MKTARYSVSPWLVLLCSTLCAIISSRAETPAPPKITGIRTNGANLAITVKVPKGWQAVVLESHANTNVGTWIPRAVARSGLSTGSFSFKVPSALKSQQFRVRGEMNEPLPKSFYKGAHAFARHKSTFWRPDQGRGEVFTLDATGGLPASATPPSAAADTRAVTESDIWKLDGNTLYFFNQLRGLQVIDVANPDAPILRGTYELPAVGEDMYLLGGGRVALLARNSCSGDWEGSLIVVDTTGAEPRQLASLPLAGWTEDSRLVGTALYVIAEGYEPGSDPANGGAEWGTIVSSYDLANPAAPVARSSQWFAGYGNTVLATDQFLFVATQIYSPDAGSQNLVEVLDSSAADGTLKLAGGLLTSGYVSDKFKMNFKNGVFTAISSGFEADPDGSAWELVTRLETFSLANPAAPLALGTLELVRNEKLFATRFDGNRAYVSTFQQVDPLWVVDLSNPSQPAVAGSVEVPGWSTYFEPLGNRLLTLGTETNRVTVSLFDVSDTSNPSLLSKVQLGENYSWSEASYDEKSLTVLAGLGLVLVPYEGDTSAGWAQRVKLIDLGSDSLKARGIIEHGFAPRRTTACNGRLLSASNRELLSVNASDRDLPSVTSDLELAWPVNRIFAAGDYVLELADGNGWYGGSGPVLRVGLASQPGVILNRYELGSQPVAGATLRDGRLYVLQSPASDYGVMVPFARPNQTAATTNLLMTVFDTSALPAVQQLGQTFIPPGNAGSGAFEAVWPSPGLLVWFSTGFNFWINPLVDARPIGLLPPGSASMALPGQALGASAPVSLVPSASKTIAPGNSLFYPPANTGLLPRPVSGTPAMSAGQAFMAMPFWWPWWGNGGVQLLAVNTSDPASPQWVSQFNFNPEGSWGFSKPFTAQGLIFFSHEQSTNLAASRATSRLRPVVDNWQINDLLDVVDYADPANPTMRPGISVPGQLTGVSPDGNVLYFLGLGGAKVGAASESREALNACAYDGVAAYWVDSINLSANWLRPVLVARGNVYLGIADSSGAGNLETWTLSSNGRFGRQAVETFAQPVSALADFNGLLAAQLADNSVALFDATSPFALIPTGSGGPNGCLWFDLNRAAGALGSGLWLPLDDYGVTRIAALPQTPLFFWLPFAHGALFMADVSGGQ